jgi:hypothetical protein
MSKVQSLCGDADFGHWTLDFRPSPASHLRAYIDKLVPHGGGIIWLSLSIPNQDVRIASRLGTITIRTERHSPTMTRKMIASDARRCFPFQTVTPLCRAWYKTGNTKDRVGVIRRGVERSMINGRAPSTRLNEKFRKLHSCFRYVPSQKKNTNVPEIRNPDSPNKEGLT